jgi:hypothetical protein
MTWTSDSQFVTAAEAARILGMTRGRVVELATSAADFPAAEATATGGRRWPRAAVEAWAAAHPDRGPLDPGLKVPPIGEWSWQVRKVIDLAAEEARALHHTWIGEDHLALALLHPDCPGAARAVLESFGVTAALLREAFVASMGDPYEPHRRWVSLSPAQQLVLERANLEAFALADAEVASEHVLLALTGRWDGSLATGWLQRHGVDAAAVCQRVVDLTEGGELPEPAPLPADEPAWPAVLDPAPGLELAPTPEGRDPAAGGHGGRRCSPTPTAGPSAMGSRCASTSSTATVTRSSPPTAGRCTCWSTSTATRYGTRRAAASARWRSRRAAGSRHVTNSSSGGWRDRRGPSRCPVGSLPGRRERAVPPC